jgi:uncharacterized membrane protein
VANRSLLSEEEKVDVMRHFLVSSMRSEQFSSALRKKEKHRRLNRFEERSPMAWNNKSGQSAISFMVTVAIVVVLLFLLLLLLLLLSLLLLLILLLSLLFLLLVVLFVCLFVCCCCFLFVGLFFVVVVKM